MTQTTQIIYGVNAVLEALRAGKRQIETITVLESARPDRLKALLELARAKGVPVHRVPRLDLDRTLGEVRHQGVVARIAATPANCWIFSKVRSAVAIRP
jgi:23S rRNA (guanosine2251-2'-O)-methyltransferase